METIMMLVKGYTGYEIPLCERPLIEYMINAETRRILNDIHATTLPNELKHIVEYRVTGEYLASNKEKVLGADNLRIVKSVREGDTTVDFGGSTPDERLDALINHLLNVERGQLSCYRRLKW